MDQTNEVTSGNSNTTAGLEPADAGSQTDDCAGIRVDDPLRLASENLERAESVLTYGRRQEAESAIVLIREAQACIKFAREGAPG